jgi:ethanolamine utilization protein EutN
MQLATVTGHATSTVKHPSLDGQRLLVCQPLNVARDPAGDLVIALDRLGARQGDTVILTSDGKGLRDLLNSSQSPARWWTLGIES